MEIYACGADTSTEYDIRTGSQGALFLCMACFYLIFEILFLCQTLRIFRKGNQVQKSASLLLFYVCMHVIIIKCCLYFLGGSVVCYSREAYLVISQYFYAFKRLAFFVIVYRIASILQQMYELTEGRLFPDRAILIAGCVDFGIYSTLYFVKLFLGIADGYLRYYGLLVDTALMSVFVWSVVLLLRKMHVLLDPGAVRSETRQWYVFTIIMATTFLMRTANVVFLVTYVRKYRVIYARQFLYAVYIAIYFVLTEITPCLVMMWVVSSSDSYQQAYAESRSQSVIEDQETE